MNDWTWRRIKDIPIEQWMLVATALALTTRLYRLDAQSLWFDEIVIVALARYGWYHGLVGSLGQGIQLTPFFHWVIKLWSLVGSSDWLLRFPAAAIGVLTVPTVYKLGQHLFDKQVGLLAAFVFAINPYQVWYGQELKLYALLPLAAAGAMLAFNQMLRTDGRQGMGVLIISNIFGFAAHYFMFLISAVQFVYITLNFRRTYPFLRRWVMCQMVAVAPLIPWWLFILDQKHFAVGVGWIPQPRWYDPLLTFWNFSFAYTGQLSLLSGLFLAVLAIALILGLRLAWQQHPQQGLLLILWLFFPPITTVLLSFRYISFYVDRYLLIIAPILTVLVAGGLASLRQWGWRLSLTVVFIAGTGLGLWRIYFDPASFAKEDWRAVAHYLDSQAASRQLVITCTDGHQLALDYYRPDQSLENSDMMVAFQAADSSVLSEYRTAWIIDVLDNPRPAHYFAKTFPTELDRTQISARTAEWETRHRQQVFTVSGISAYQYTFDDPQPLLEVTQWFCSK